ncbi:cytochrome P450 3A56-like isoform X2 [Colossoma macropomum]|uniref:cytochrome P450 3A56-like isoform X2 n=1 Tax=Colossoma macropomum TaxID=42526 RepID=UPI001863D22F|nr:cytochrome P450 3A56-like isoform X2 [Colossoma macropomum]
MGYIWFFSAETWALLLLFISLLLLYGYWPNSFFRKLGIPGPKPLPLLGNMLEYRKGVHGLDMDCFMKYGRIWGIYDGRMPILCVMDRTIIKSVFVKECYSLFTNRRDFGLNGLLYDSLFVAIDEDWKRIRNILSPCFTSGRLKEMFGIMKTHSDTLVKNLEKTAKEKSGVHVKELFGAYSMDVITSSAFSVDIDSLNNPKDPFVTNVKKLLNFDFLKPTFLITVLFPFTIPLLEKMNVAFFPTSATDFFCAVLKKIKADRVAKDHKSRVDFMQLMVDSQTPEKAADQQGEEIKKGLSDHEILSQSVSFIFAGYETSSSTLSFFFYSMATNPETMKKLQEEIDQTFPDKAPVQYDAVMSMEYLDAALNETLRLYPVAARIDRIAKKTVEINGVTIPEGTTVMIPIYPLHRDPEYWPDPDTFNPERFTKENKESIDPYAFMPFGAGPRNCIGMRFALVSMKLAIVEILQRFDINVCDETKVPLELGVGAFLAPKDPIQLNFTPRANSKSG